MSTMGTVNFLGIYGKVGMEWMSVQLANLT